jgi:YD repeat-containing protein
LGQITQFFYDNLGRPIGQAFADETNISSEYNESGRLIARTDQEGIRPLVMNTIVWDD